MKITGAQTHIVDTLIPEEHRVRRPGLGVDIDWDFVADHPYSGEIGIGAGSRPAFGLATEMIPDRTSSPLA